MCEAMKILMHDEMKEAQRDGEIKAKRETAYELYIEDGFSAEKIAKRLKVSVDIVNSWLKECPVMA